MQRQILGLTFILFIVISNLYCQNSGTIATPEKKSIEKTINMYFDGWMTGDTTKVGGAMHSTCKLKLIKEGKVIAIDRAGYLSNFTPRPKLEGASGRIIMIDITGPIASAKCELEIPNRIYTDYFNMMKLEDTWYIVDKISTNVSK